jgi:ERCC4-related helicase
MPEKTLKKIIPRKYQQDIYESCKEKNCLVVLPTGIGKTLIALMLSIYTQKKHPATKTLFLAPTRPLAEQHLSYFKKHLPELFAELTLFTGKITAEKRKELWERSEIIFSTPQCVSNDLKNDLYSLEEVSLLIEDECHRCLKNYAYTNVAQKYKEQGKFQKVLGLTASPGIEKQKIKQIASNLGIETIELRTRDSVDVKEYLQELEFNVIRIEFPEKFKEIDTLIKNLYNKKIQELKNRKLLFEPPSKTNILKLQGKIMATINSGNKHFNLLIGASICAQAIKLSHLIELLETQTIYTAKNYINSMYEQAAQKKSKAVVNIVKSQEFSSASIKLNELIAKKIEHPKLLELKSLMEESIVKNPKNKTIIFSQFRDTTIKIAKELNQIPNINAKVFVGQTKKGDTGLTQKEQHQIMEEFKEGTINVIAATSIAEEGLDIPEVNSVIFYEPIPSAIRKIQRAGRTARLMKGRLIILLTLDTLDEIFYYASRAREKKMYASIESIKNDLDQGKSIEPRKPKIQKTLF